MLALLCCVAPLLAQSLPRLASAGLTFWPARRFRLPYDEDV